MYDVFYMAMFVTPFPREVLPLKLRAKFYLLLPRLPMSDFEFSILFITEFVVLTPDCTLELLGRSIKFLKNR